MSENPFQEVSIVSGGKEGSIHLFFRVHVKNQFSYDWLNLRLAQVNKSPRANVFPAGKANFGQAMYRSLEKYSAQASFSWPRVDLARPLRRDEFRPLWIISFEFVKVCWIRFSRWESFISFYLMLNPISTRSQHVYLPLKFEFRGNVVLEREQLRVYGGRDAISFLLPCVLVYTYSVILVI